MKKILLKLEVQVILALILGIIVGIYFPNIIINISWMGDLFMRLLKVFLAPLLFFSIMSAVLGLGNIKKLGNIGAKTFFYYMITTVFAIVLSLVLMNVFKPGEGITFKEFENFNSASVQALTFSNFILGLIPNNMIESFVQLNAMQIVVIGIILSIFILQKSTKGKIKKLNNLINTINNGILGFISFVIKLTPLGVFAIVGNVIVKNGIESMINLLPFVGIILLALFIQAFIILPGFGIVVGRFNPLKYFLQIKKAILVAFSTASSSATMGVTMQVAKEKAELNEEVVNFTVPIGTTINMNGTALYQAGVAIFVSQIVGIDLSIIQQLTIVIVVVLASVGAAGVPGAGILVLTTVFLTIGLPIEAIGIILAVDRILDMFRTGVNVWGDLITAKIIDKYYEKDLGGGEKSIFSLFKKETSSVEL